MRKTDSPDISQLFSTEGNAKEIGQAKSNGLKKGVTESKLIHAHLLGGHSYDAMLAEKSVRPELLLFDARFWRIAKTILTVTMSNWQLEAGGKPVDKVASAALRAKAKKLTNDLVDLGATFIKLGQFLSVRRDLLPVELAEELSYLQDKVPPFSSHLVRQTIHAELGAYPEAVFAQFDANPVASASIGQVHKAILKDGQMAAVKVQRSNLASLLYQDMGYMRWFAKLAIAVKLKGDWRGWLELSDEFGRTLFTEIDYIKEGRNADRLRHALRSRNDVLVPKVYWKYTGRKVLTLEYIAGTKIDNLSELKNSGVDLNELGKHLIDCYMEQVMTHGFFHADPHAGNLAVDEQGRLIIYDFGMMGEINAEQRDTIWGCIGAVVNREVAELTRYLSKLGIIRNTAEIAPIERTLSPFINYYSGQSIQDLDFSHLERDIDQIAMEGAFRLPPDLAYLIRTGVTLEGVARTLKPDFSFVEAAKPSLKKWLAKQPSYAAGLLSLLYRKKVTLGEGPEKKLSTVRSVGEPSIPSLPGQEIMPNGKQNDKLRASVGNNSLGAAVVVPKRETITLQNSKLRGYSQRLRQVGIVVVLQFLFNLYYWQGHIVTKELLDSNYILIGNVLMGAIILCLLAKPGSLKSRFKKLDN